MKPAVRPRANADQEGCMASLWTYDSINDDMKYTKNTRTRRKSTVGNLLWNIGAT